MRKTLLATAVATAMAIGITATASHNSFTDVPDDHLFFNGVEWALANGITVGCGDGTEFCPDDPVTRGQMVTFLKRYDDNLDDFDIPVGLGFGFRTESDTPDPGNGAVPGLSLNLNIPLSGVLVLTSSVYATNLVDLDAFSCGINTGGSVGTAESDSWRIVDLTGSIADTCATQTAIAVSPGTQVARVVISDALETTTTHAGSISAVLYLDVGAFGLLNASEQVPPPATTDEPKS